MCNACYDIDIRAAFSDDLEPTLKRVSKMIYKGELGFGDIDDKMLRLMSKEILSGIELGYDLQYDDTYLKMVRNGFFFSGAKTATEIDAISKLLQDDRGSFKSFPEFYKAVKEKIDPTYNRSFLKAEYNHAFASAQMAKNWKQYQENADVFPYLTYQTAGDDRVRASHDKLDGITKHINDPFWRTYYPPNDWNCRCDVIQKSKGPATVTKKLPGIKASFQHNVGITAQVFPNDHPYYKARSPLATIALFSKIASRFTKYTARYKNYETYLLQDYRDYGFDRDSGGFLVSQYDKLRTHEVKSWLKLVRRGDTVVALRKSGNKSPDAIFRSNLTELKTISEVGVGVQQKVSRSLYQKARQSKYIVLDLDFLVNEDRAYEVARGLRGAALAPGKYKFNVVYVLINDEPIKFTYSEAIGDFDKLVLKVKKAAREE